MYAIHPTRPIFAYIEQSGKALVIQNSETDDRDTYKFTYDPTAIAWHPEYPSRIYIAFHRMEHPKCMLADLKFTNKCTWVPITNTNPVLENILYIYPVQSGVIRVYRDRIMKNNEMLVSNMGRYAINPKYLALLEKDSIVIKSLNEDKEYKIIKVSDVIDLAFDYHNPERLYLRRSELWAFITVGNGYLKQFPRKNIHWHGERILFHPRLKNKMLFVNEYQIVLVDSETLKIKCETWINNGSSYAWYDPNYIIFVSSRQYLSVKIAFLFDYRYMLPLIARSPGSAPAKFVTDVLLDRQLFRCIFSYLVEN